MTWNPGVAFDVLLGFFFANTLLFVLTLVTPWGIGINGVCVLAGTVPCLFVRARPAVLRRGSAVVEAGSLACVAFSGVAASLWVSDQQPMTKTSGDTQVFTVWSDVFIHVREISAFAQAHGLESLTDIKLSGVRAAAYHFASYMVPAALNATTSTSAMDAYAAFQLPFGILLTGLAAYVLPAILLRNVWPALVGCIAVLAMPDAYEQGFHIRYLSFHFMSMVNLGMFYGVACITLAWLFMIEACRRRALQGVVLAYLMLAICASYKAHLFVANALVLMLYPCVFFGNVRRLWRVCALVAVVALFVGVVSISQWSPRVPTLRVDGSGIRPYMDILFGGFGDGRLKSAITSVYYRQGSSHIVDAVLVSSILVLGSFGAWAVLSPLGLVKGPARRDRLVGAFFVLIVVNYLAMASLLALDERGIGSREEFVNRPHAWAYFVMVALGAASLAAVAGKAKFSAAQRAAGIAFLAALGLLFVERTSIGFQTFPEWSAHAHYADFNSAPSCLVHAAEYARDHGDRLDVLQDSRFDPAMIVTAVAERQAYVIDANFGGGTDVVVKRVAELKVVGDSGDTARLAAWAGMHRVHWYLLHPEDSIPWDASFLNSAVYRCGDYRLFALHR